MPKLSGRLPLKKKCTTVKIELSTITKSNILNQRPTKKPITAKFKYSTIIWPICAKTHITSEKVKDDVHSEREVMGQSDRSKTSPILEATFKKDLEKETIQVKVRVRDCQETTYEEEGSATDDDSMKISSSEDCIEFYDLSSESSISYHSDEENERSRVPTITRRLIKKKKDAQTTKTVTTNEPMAEGEKLEIDETREDNKDKEVPGILHKKLGYIHKQNIICTELQDSGVACIPKKQKNNVGDSTKSLLSNLPRPLSPKGDDVNNNNSSTKNTPITLTAYNHLSPSEDMTHSGNLEASRPTPPINHELHDKIYKEFNVILGKVIPTKGVGKKLYRVDDDIPVVSHMSDPIVVNGLQNKGPGDSDTIDMYGSFIRSSDNERYDFFDVDKLGNVLHQPKIPIFPEDFPQSECGQKEPPLSWWGIVGSSSGKITLHSEKSSMLTLPLPDQDPTSCNRRAWDECS